MAEIVAAMAAQRQKDSGPHPFQQKMLGSLPESLRDLGAADLWKRAAGEADSRRVRSSDGVETIEALAFDEDPVCDPSEAPDKILEDDARRLRRAARRREHGELLDVDKIARDVSHVRASLITTIRSDTPITS